MKKPKEIKLIFLLAFLFAVSSCFSQSETKKDSLKTNKKTYQFKFGLNYLPERAYFPDLNFAYSGGSGGRFNPSMSLKEQANLEALGPYLSFGRIYNESRYFSFYAGVSYTNTRFHFRYIKSGSSTNSISFPYYFHKRNEIAEGFIIRNMITFEMNFHVGLKNSKLILSPINPSFIISNLIAYKKEIEEYDAIGLYSTNGTVRDSITSPIISTTGDFKVQRPNLPLKFILPIYIGFEQKIPLRKRILLIGLKGTILIVRNSDDFYGGQLYAGFEF